MPGSRQVEQQLVHMAFLHREEGFVHLNYSEEMRPYEYMRDGDMRAMDEARSMIVSEQNGRVSNDPLRNMRYLFVASVTMATRYAIGGGMDQETAYNLSDLYILRADEAESVDAVVDLHVEMIETYTKRMAEIHTHPYPSRITLLAMDYIYMHLQEPLTAEDVAAGVGRSRSYLSLLFKRETGLGIAEYIRRKRLEAAENMLKSSDFSLQEIADYLAFSSQSHFSTLFKQHTGLTPGVYREKYYRQNWQRES